LQRARDLPLHRWIYALAIPDVGDVIARQLARAHDSLEELARSPVLRDIRDLGEMDAERKGISPRSRKNPPKDDKEKQERAIRHEELTGQVKELETRLKHSPAKTALAEVGPVVAGSVLDFFASDAGKAILTRLGKLGIHPQPEAGLTPESPKETPLAGRTFVLTGTLPNLKRDEATAMIESQGGKVTGSVSRNTDYVVAGEEAGSKLDKARKLGIAILDEAALRKLCEGA
jgi:DNA ligase (NAD+)